MDILATMGSFALATLVLLISASLLWLVSEAALGKQTFRFELGAVLFPVIVGMVLFSFWGWKSVWIVLVVFFGLWVISGLWERVTSGVSGSAGENTEIEKMHQTEPRWPDDHQNEMTCVRCGGSDIGAFVQYGSYFLRCMACGEPGAGTSWLAVSQMGSPRLRAIVVDPAQNEIEVLGEGTFDEIGELIAKAAHQGKLVRLVAPVDNA